MRKSLVITFRNEVTPHCTTEACRTFKNRRKLAATTLVSYYFTLSLKLWFSVSDLVLNTSLKSLNLI